MGEQLFRISNRSRGTEVASRALVADSLRERTVGLLAHDSLAPGDGLLIRRSPSIHIFGMRFAIDAVFLAADGRVTKCVANLKTWQAVLWVPGAVDCLELPVGTIERTGTQPGDYLELAPA